MQHALPLPCLLPAWQTLQHALPLAYLLLGPEVFNRRDHGPIAQLDAPRAKHL